MGSPRNLTNLKGTIPLEVALNGTVTTDTNDHKVLNYAGTSDIGGIFPLWKCDQDGIMYIFVPTATKELVRVVSVFNTGTNTWNIFLAEEMTGVSAQPCYSVESNLAGWSVLNDGGASGLVNGATLVEGANVSDPQLSPRQRLVHPLPAVLLDATGTDFLITENTIQN